MNAKRTYLWGCCLSVTLCMTTFLVTNIKGEEAGRTVSKMELKTNTSELPSEAVVGEMRTIREQDLAEAIEFSVAFINKSKNSLTCQAYALLDAMVISVKHKDDTSLSLPANVRFLVNSQVLPERPYQISGWRIVTKTPDGEKIVSQLPLDVLLLSDPKAIREARIEMPDESELIVDLKIAQLARKVLKNGNPETKMVKVPEGEYELDLSALLVLMKNGKSEKMRFSLGKPVSITVK